MNSHIVSASALEARLLSSSPETDVQPSVPTLVPPTVCDPANGVDAPVCACAGGHVRLSRGN